MTLDGPAARALRWRRWERKAAPARVLGALAGGYRGLVGAREWLYARGVLKSRWLDCPVVSVGNLTVGGTGKTPAVLLAVHTLAEMGHNPAVVSRGYGRRTRGVHVVADTATIRLDAEEGGDEPFLLARRLPGVPVVVGENRYEAARVAITRFAATAIVLDDGFQHRTLGKSLEIVMARAVEPWGNGRLLPAGPLREPLSALARADLVVATGARSSAEAGEVVSRVHLVAPGVPVLPAVYVPAECWEIARMEPVKLSDLARARLVAFAGIASPAGFERSLAEVGTRVAELITFPDHHWYSRDEVVAMAERAQALGADGLVTTEKDWVRLRHLTPPHSPLFVLSVRLELAAGDAEWQRAFDRTCRPR